MDAAKKNQEIETKKTGRLDAACARYGLGRNTMRDVAETAGAVIRIGKCYLINFTVMDRYMDCMTNK